MRTGHWVAFFGLWSLSAVGCATVCDEVADEAEASGCAVGAQPDAEEAEPVECSGDLEKRAQCLLDNTENVCSPTEDELAAVQECIGG